MFSCQRTFEGRCVGGDPHVVQTVGMDQWMLQDRPADLTVTTLPFAPLELSQSAVETDEVRREVGEHVEAVPDLAGSRATRS